jgi:hypothetical protein
VPVRVSCTFSWDKPRAEWLAEQWSARSADVELGGPAYDDPGGEFVAGRFVASGAVITSRGCPRICDFCLVPRREGALRELESIAEGYNVLDNNLLACSEPHLDRVFAMLGRQKRGIKFSGGLDAGLLREDHVRRLSALRLDSVWFAADSDASLEALAHAGRLLAGGGITSIEKRRAFVLFRPGPDTLQKAEARARRVFRLGFLPMAMLYRGEESSARRRGDEWDRLTKFWARPAMYRAALKGAA